MKSFLQIILMGILMFCFAIGVQALEENPDVQSETLLQAIRDISERYDVHFTYDREIVENVEVKEYKPDAYANVNVALKNVLKGTNLKYVMLEMKYVIIYQDDAAGMKSLEQMVEVLEKIIAQKTKRQLVASLDRLESSSQLNRIHLEKHRMVLNVTGTVTDQAGEPLIGVNVVVKGTNIGTATDIDGRFVLEDVNENATLVFSYVGYQTQDFVLNGRSNISINMVEDLEMLEEVVVVGYGTQKKVNLTGAVSYIDSDVLENRPLTNVAQGLQGVIPNLNISFSSGALGESADFNVRGFTSINGGSPLILINGVPGDINMLNPNDIQEVSVLKDAASAAIYGARGAYGVILITTKKGGDHKPRISFSMNYAMNKPTVFNDIMDSKERLEYYNIATMRQSGTPYFDEIREEAILAHYNDPSQPALIRHPDIVGYYGAANINWPREVMRTSYPMQHYNVNVSGGSDKFNYYTSFAYMNQEGIAKGFDEQYNRYNLTSELSYDINDWITVGSNILVNKSDKHYPPDPTTGAFDEDVNYLFSNSWSEDPVYDQEGRYYTKDGKINMVQFIREGGYRQKNTTEVWLTGKLILSPFKNTTINFNYTYNNQDAENLDYLKSLVGYNERPIGIYQTEPSSVDRVNQKSNYKAINAYINYENNFGLHNVKATLGYNQENSSVFNFTSYRENLIIGNIPFLSLATGAMQVSDGRSEFALRGGFGRINYNYDNRYLLELNGRYDGSSKFPKNNRFELFPSISIGWRLDNENFFSGLKNTFDLLKIRASYGNLGNQDVSGYYPYIATFSTSQIDYLIGGNKPLTAYAPGLISPTLTWEVVSQKNLGLDFAIFNYRLSGSFDIYRRDTKDMLTASQPLPSILGVAEPRTNAADLKTTGFDVSIDWKQKINKGQIELALILSDYTAEITKYANPNGLIGSYYIGKKIGTIWGLVTDGLFQSDEEAQSVDQNNITGRVLQAGDLRFVDINGDGRITRGASTLDDPGDQKIIGNSTPRYSFGIRPGLEWNGLDITVFVQGVMKRDVRLATTDFLYQYQSQWNAQPKVGADYWTEENRDAYFPAPLITNSRDVTTAQTRFLQNAAYARLKELTIGYTFPKLMTDRIGMDRIRVYLSGFNIAEITDMIESVDPEFTNSRLYPIHRSFSIGANVQF